MRFFLVLVVAFATFSLSTSAAATLITYEATGTVTSLLGGGFSSVSVGDPYSVTLTLDDATIDSNASGAIGRYSNGVVSYSLTVGSYSASGGGDIDIDISSDHTVQLRDDLLFQAPTLDGLIPISFVPMALTDQDSVILVDDGIPSSATLSDSAPWEVREFQLVFQFGPSQPTIFGELSSVQVVPEPSTALFLGLGLLGLARPRLGFLPHPRN